MLHNSSGTVSMATDTSTPPLQDKYPQAQNSYRY